MKHSFAIILGIILGGSLFAQDFEVAPVELNFSCNPGDMQTKQLTVKNHGNTKTSFILSLNDFLIDSKGDRTFHPPSTTKNSIANYLNISPSFFELNPNEEKLISVSLQSPIESYGSLWGIMYVQTVEEQTSFQVDKTLSAGVMLSARIIVELFQSPKANTNVSAKINKLEEITEISDDFRKFRASVDNLGDKITKCKVYLIASNLESAEETYFDPIEITIYPKSSRQIQLVLNKTLTKGRYSLAAILDYGSDSNLEGTQVIIDVQ